MCGTMSPTIACGYCSYCRAGYYAQRDTANPNGPAEYARIPFAHVGLIRLPDEVSDEQAILHRRDHPGRYGAFSRRVGLSGSAIRPLCRNSRLAEERSGTEGLNL